MNNLRLLLVSSLLLGQALAQQTNPSVDASEKPSKTFSNTVPDGSSWQVTVVRPWEKGKYFPESAGSVPPPPSGLENFANTTLKKIEVSFAGGVRKEVLTYMQGPDLTRYLTSDMVLYENPKTKEPMIDEPGDTVSAPFWGSNKMEELSWISDRHYIGTAQYLGRTCYVYRLFASGKVRNLDEPAPLFEGISRSETANQNGAAVIATAFIDKATMRPVALETAYDIWIYNTGVPFSSFTVPSHLKDAVRQRAEAIAKRKQRHNIPQ